MLGEKVVPVPFTQLPLGFGLRPQYYEALEQHRTPLPPIEILADNYMAHQGGPTRAHLQKILKKCSFVCVHGVGLNIASTDELSLVYLSHLKEFAAQVGAQVVSDHLCWTRLNNVPTWELMPFPYTQKMLNHIVARVNYVQNYLGRKIALENVSAYVAFAESQMSEASFLAQVHEQTGCGVLLDVNNMFVSASNFGFDAKSEMLKIPRQAVVQFHIAGHSEEENFYYDTHDKPVKIAVWKLLKWARSYFGYHLPVTLENDDESTPFSAIEEELRTGRVILDG